ncbi:MAG: carboxypeptidase-like regulatory domain-containing protein [Bacteroidetes bacterium]|nr:MAG: carboxypeptidase-like regulatory domain-containing protein [Bacteroidota bacterium]
MIRHLIFIVLLFSIIHPVIYCQQLDYIRGKVIDSKTSKPVPFATVRLKTSLVGVISNAEGDFRILNKPGFQSDSLIVTCIGFHRLSVAFSKLKNTETNNLKLIPYIYSLNEVSVTARKRRLSSQIIIGRALRNIKKNYPVNPFGYVSYYRDYQKDSSNYLNLNEGIIQTLDKGFTYSSDSNRYRLLDFKKNMDFTRTNITPYYDLPETDHSDVWFKKVPNAIVGDQYGNELFILLVHDAIRNCDTRSFSFVDTLTKDFIRNHKFSNPVGVHEGNTLLYKIDFTVKRKITGDSVHMKGVIFIQPDDYSIHKLEYSASYSNSEIKNKEIFNIETEYGHESAVNSKMCLKYISFNNTFTIPDSSDNDFFKMEKSEWRQAGGPYVLHPWDDMTIVVFFNKKVDPILGLRKENYDMTIGKRKAKITRIKVDGPNVYITVRDDKFTREEQFSVQLSIENLKDINGNILNKRKELEFRQFRELFVQEYNKPLEFQNNCFIQSVPLEQNCISISDNSGRFWMNTPLIAEEKQQDSQNH